tara:strand:+ start:945 stop:1421 length:477 start_codon:yes stop_codon:yes gene_type:complete
LYKLILFTLLSVNLYSEDSILTINKLIKNNLNFVQTTDSGFKEINSKGTLIRNNELIEIMIDFPSKEKYIIRDSIIEIYDYEFNQSQIITINDENSFLFDFLANGIDADRIDNINDNSFSVLTNDSRFFVNVISENSFSITYNDNMEYKNLIVFEVLK